MSVHVDEPVTKKHRSAEQKADVVRAHSELVNLRHEGVVLAGSNIDQLAARLFGIGERTVRRYVSESVANNGVVSRSKPKGCPPTILTNGSITSVRDFVRKCAQEGRPLSISMMKEHLSGIGVSVSRMTLSRKLKTIGIKFGRGKRRNVAHESAGVVTYRGKFLRHLLQNRDVHGLPIRSEVYLDESYVNQNHKRQLTWYEPESWVSDHSGAGPRYCMFGAISYTNIQGTLFGEWVPAALQYWPANRQSRVDDKHEYHGNIDHDQFNAWFEKLGERCRDELGSCVIVMDGAGYHKTAIERAPTKSATKSKITDWLQRNKIPHLATMKKAELYELVKDHKAEVVRYHATEIAEKFGHTVSYTPPYHPELQPMELVWAQLKNPIAASVRMTMAELGEAIGSNAKDLITEHTLKGAWNRCQTWVQKYWSECDDDFDRASGISSDDEESCEESDDE
jgi:transposase